MEEPLAESIIDGSLAIGRSLNELTALTERVTDVSLQAALRRQIGEAMGQLYTSVMLPIVRRYPDLDPARQGG